MLAYIRIGEDPWGSSSPAFCFQLASQLVVERQQERQECNNTLPLMFPGNWFTESYNISGSIPGGIFVYHDQQLLATLCSISVCDCLLQLSKLAARHKYILRQWLPQQHSHRNLPRKTGLTHSYLLFLTMWVNRPTAAFPNPMPSTQGRLKPTCWLERMGVMIQLNWAGSFCERLVFSPALVFALRFNFITCYFHLFLKTTPAAKYLLENILKAKQYIC